MPIRRVVSLLVLAAALLLSACVERKEKLIISPDRSVLWQVNHRSDSFDDLLQGDAVPTAAGGWFVEQGQELDDEGKITYTVAAETAMSAKQNGRLPDGFGTPRDIAAEVCLRFPASVVFEKRSDGVYCHFSRTYQPRAWAHVEQLRAQLMDDVLQSSGDDPEQWTPEQRLAITRALAAFEVEKTLIFTRAAWLAALPKEPQDGYLVIRDDLHAFLDTLDYPRLTNLLVPPENAEQETALQQAIELETRQLKQAIIARLNDAAQKLAGLDASKAQALLAAFDVERRTFETTEDLNDDGFEITVEMPGEIIASNAESVSGRSATWRFKGEQLHDCAMELLVTSRVED